MIGSNYIIFETIPSTNDYAKQHFDDLQDGTVIRSMCQTAGRGQRGKLWLSPAGDNIYTSLVLKPQVNLLKNEELTLKLVQFCAMAIKDVLSDLYGLEAVIKPPNDIYLQGGKLAGILVEAISRGLQVRGYLVGIGINCNTTCFPPEISGIATSIEIVSGKKVNVDVFFSMLVKYCDKHYQLIGK